MQYGRHTVTATAGTLRLLDFLPDHIPGAVALSQAAGWPHRAEDWALTLSQSSGVVAVEGEKLVGTALVSDFGPVATLSMIIVDAPLRGRGLGRKLMDAILARAGDSELRLIATSDGLPLYEKLGFVRTGDVIQCQGLAQPVAATPAQGADADFPVDMAGMDTAASGMSRADLLARVAGSGRVFGSSDGFALLRDFGRGRVLGPIVANSLDGAKSLLAQAASAQAGQFLRIDTPSAELADYAQTLGLDRVGGGVCMRRQHKPTAPSGTYRTYGLVSQALG
jgi:GNAT superfamily N-acetyltransferase